MPANVAACFHTSALHPAQYSWPGTHDKGLCLLPGSRFPGVLLPLFQAEQHLRTFFKTSLTIFPCCGIVIKSTTWARSSAGRAFGSHPRGRGFDPLRVHQNNIIRTFCRLVMGSDLLFLLEKSKTGNEENRRTVDHAKVHLKTKKRTDILQT